MRPQNEMSHPGANEPTVEELKRLAAALPKLGVDQAAFDYNHFTSDGWSAEQARFLAYAANHAVEIIDRLRAELAEAREDNQGLKQAWKKLMDEHDALRAERDLDAAIIDNLHRTQAEWGVKIVRLTESNRRLREACENLMKSALRHNPTCNVYRQGTTDGKCNCGRNNAYIKAQSALDEGE